MTRLLSSRILAKKIMGLGLLSLSMGLVPASTGRAAESADADGRSSSTYRVEFGPYVGGGTASNGALVRNTSGYVLSIERPFVLPVSSLKIGPTLTIANTFANTKMNTDGEQFISAYDSRIGALGAKLSLDLAAARDGEAPLVFVGAGIGRGMSKLVVDQSSNRTYVQNLYGNIDGDYIQTEVGGWLPLKRGFGMSLSLLASDYHLQQGRATGSYQGNRLQSDGSLALVEGRTDSTQAQLDESLTLRAYALKIGLVLGF